MKKILIIGGASAIATETAKFFAKDGASLFLVDINPGRLEAVKDDINTFYPTTIHTFALNVNEFERHKEMFDIAVETLGGLDAVLIAHGTLPDQEKIKKNNLDIIREFNTNCVSVISIASIAANYFEEKKAGCIAAISSVAGDRGRQSNYIYGSAKGGISIFFQGLRNRLSSSNVSVVTIKPGFVDTPMTANMPKNPLYSSPVKIGKGIYDAMKAGKDIVYLPGFWRCIMMIIKMIPEGIFKKLKL
jgi:decaprenylphospho-beta-D-erythro-pentofuranosid-2-ulose 2-reductase